MPPDDAGVDAGLAIGAGVSGPAACAVLPDSACRVGCRDLCSRPRVLGRGSLVASSWNPGVSRGGTIPGVRGSGAPATVVLHVWGHAFDDVGREFRRTSSQPNRVVRGLFLERYSEV